LKKRFHTVLLLALVLVFQANAQDHDLLFSGNFQDIPFSEFVASVEAQTGGTFYYFDAWVNGIRISAEGANLSLNQVLQLSLLPAGIHHYIDAYGNIYLTHENPLIPSLAYQDAAEIREDLEAGDGTTETLSGAEQRYIEGHRSGMLETLVVGEGQSGSSQSEYIIYGKMIDSETGEPLIGATVYVEDLKRGAATDVDGRFSIRLGPGRHRVAFNCMGMEPRENILQVLSGGNLVISMEKGLIPITEVVVRANKYDNVRGSQMGFERLNYKTHQGGASDPWREGPVEGGPDAARGADGWRGHVRDSM
jgi:hypothetical protein